MNTFNETCFNWLQIVVYWTVCIKRWFFCLWNFCFIPLNRTTVTHIVFHRLVQHFFSLNLSLASGKIISKSFYIKRTRGILISLVVFDRPSLLSYLHAKLGLKKWAKIVAKNSWVFNEKVKKLVKREFFSNFSAALGRTKLIKNVQFCD